MNKQKSGILVLILLVVLVLTLSTMTTAASYSTDALKLSLINQDPDPVSPGDYVTVKIRVENLGEESVSGVSVNLIPKYPFSLNPDDSTVRSVGTVSAFQKKTDSADLSAVVEYKLRVARDAVNGNNKLQVEFTSDSSPKQTLEFDVEVKTQDSGLTVSSVKSDEFEQGKKGYLELILSNPSDTTLRDVTVNLDLSSTTLPFAPIDSATSKKLKYLNPGQESIFRFGLIPEASAETKVYKIPVEISYYDSSNELITKDELVGVVVGGEADLSVYAEANKFYQDSTEGVVNFKFVNKGLINVKLLNAVMIDTEDYEVVSSKQAYVGSVDSDDFQNTEFNLLRKSTKNPFDLKVVVTYMDANNNKYNDEIVVPLKLYKNPVKSSPYPVGLVIGLLLIAGGFIGIKLWKKKKDA